MKNNQNDIIISAVAIVLALIIAGVCFGTKREPIAPAAPEAVNLTKPALPQGDVVMASSLPGASGGSGGGGGFGGAGGPSGIGGGFGGRGGGPSFGAGGLGGAPAGAKPGVVGSK